MAKKSIFSKKQIQYFEAIVYIVAIIVVIFCKVYGTIYFSFIPLLVILGIVGKCLFKREIVTTVFGVIVSICMVYTKGQMNIIENILYSFLLGLDIALGELLGTYLLKTYKKIVNASTKKARFNKGAIEVYVITFVILIITLNISIFTNGNLFDYIKCKNSVDKYIEESYDLKEDFEIVDAVYTMGFNRSYIFKVLNKQDDSISNFTVYLKNKNIVKDEYKEKILAKNINKIKEKLNTYLEENNYADKYEDLQISIEYLEKEKVKIILDKKVENVDKNEQEIFAKQIVSFIADIKTCEIYKDVEELQISLSNENQTNDILVSSIYMEGYEKNILTQNEEPYLYILKALSIEYIDSK